MDFDDKQIAPPKYWQKFEDLCLAIFGAVWGDPTAQKNGRSGQPQHGVDVWGRPYQPDAFHGVQCKGKDGLLGSTLTEGELRDEVSKALNFQPGLSHWVLATSAPKDAKLEEVARTITEEHRAKGLFAVQVLGWEDLQSLMVQHPAVIERFYPDQAPSVRLALLRLALGAARSNAGSAELARQRAVADLEAFEHASAAKSPILLSIELERSSGERRSTTHQEIADVLIGGATIVLEAEPGAGKSTSLIQLGRTIIDDSPVAIPVLVPLKELTNPNVSVWEEIFARPRFAEVGVDGLRALAEAGLITFLCDGWNELSEPQRARIHVELKKLKREFGKAGLVVATRALSPITLIDSQRAFLLPLTTAQQLEILSASVKGDAEALLVRARRQPGLHDIIRNPFYLQALASVGAGGPLPETRDEILRNFVRGHDNHPDHRDALRSALSGCHDQYLRRIAFAMSEMGIFDLKESDFRRQISKVSRALVDEGQFNDAGRPDPGTALATLVSHHILIDAGEQEGERAYSFQHQQFQEWYASFHVEDVAVAARTRPRSKDARVLDDLLNRPDMQEAVFFAVERLSRNVEKRSAIELLVPRALRIDPVFAAEIVRRLPSDVWSSVSRETVAYARGLLDTSAKARAVRFMGSCGRPEFGDVLWPILADEKAFNELTYVGRGWLKPASLGPDAKKRFKELDAKTRRALLWDFCVNGGQEETEFALDIASEDADPEVVTTVLDHVTYDGSQSEVNQLLSHLSADAWAYLAKRGQLQQFKGDYRDKLLSLKRDRASKLTGVDRFYALSELAECGETVDPQEMISLVLAGKFKDHHREYSAFEFLHQNYGSELEEALADAVTSGRDLPYYALRHMRPVARGSQSELLEMARKPGDGKQVSRQRIARALNESSIAEILREFCDSTVEVMASSGQERQNLQVHYSSLVDTLTATDISALLPVIISFEVTKAVEVSALSEVLFRWRDDEYDKPLPVPADMGPDLSKAIIAWGRLLGSSADTRRYEVSNLASAIKRVGRQDLLPTLTALLDFELKECAQDRADRVEWSQTGRPLSRERDRERDNVNYTALYRQALAVFSGNDVRDLLLSKIGKEDFEIEAAFELRRFGTERPIDGPATAFHRAKYERLSSMREKQPNIARRPVSDVARVVLDRIDALVATRNKDDLARAIKLATAAVQMDYGDRLSTILSVIDASERASSCYGLFETMLFLGLPTRAGWITKAYKEASDSYFAQEWHNQNDWWMLRQWFDLLALSDDPEQLITLVSGLSKEVKREHNFHEVVYALGFSTAPGATKALIGLAREIPNIVTQTDWFRAMQQIGDEEAARYVLEIMSNPPAGSSRGIHGYPATDVLGALLRAHPKVKRELVARLKAEKLPTTRQVLADALARSLTRDDILPVLDVVVDENDPVLSALLRGVCELALEKIPLGSNTYEQAPFDLSDLRKHLFQLATSKDAKAKLSYRLLMAIEEQRDAYGRPPSEPRHPDISSGLPWPLDRHGLDRRRDSSTVRP